MRLIDADATFQEMIKTIANMMRSKRWMRMDKDNEDEILSVIKNAPTIDAVPVVRCKDCKHFSPYEGEEYKGDCMELVGLESCVYEEDFCSYGERKDNHETD